MSKVRHVLETRRPEFFKAVALADTLVRLKRTEGDEFEQVVEAAVKCMDDVRTAYDADLARMAAVVERLRDRKRIEEFER